MREKHQMSAIKRDGDWRQFVCLLLGDHGREPSERIEVGPQSPLGGRAMRCGRCGRELAHYVNSPAGRLD